VTTVPSVVRRNAADDDRSEFLRLLFAGRDDEIYSYSNLVTQADAWAALYTELELGYGDRVIVALEHSFDLYAAFLGAILGGQVPAMFAFPSPKLSEDEYFRTVGTLLTGASAKLFVTYGELAGKLQAREGAALSGTRIVTPVDVRSSRERTPTPSGTPADTAFLQYSSGTTGLKKGVAVSHEALLWQVQAYGDAIGAGPRDRIVSWLPLYHDMGLIACFFLPFLRKIPLVAMSPFDWVKRPSLWAQAVADHAGTLSWQPNFTYNFLASNLSLQRLSGVDLSSLRGIVNCSEPLHAASHEAFLDAFGPLGITAGHLATSYALAENTFAATSGGFGTNVAVDWIDARALERDARAVPAKPRGSGARALVSSGRALPETEISIRAESGAPVPERTIGEIVLRSPSLMSGYDANAEATAAALRADGYWTGDLGYLADGELFVTGRKQDLIIIGGRNIYPQDVERVVNDVPGISPGRAVAFGVERAELGTEALVVLAETEADGSAELDRLRAAVHDSVVRHTDLTPADIRLVAPRVLLKSSSGKLARKENRARYLEEREAHSSNAHEQRDMDLGATIRRCVTRLLPEADDQDRIGDDDPLFTSGLIDSFGLAELLSSLEAEVGTTVPDGFLDVERFDTIAEISRTMEAVQASEAPRRETNVAAPHPQTPPTQTSRGRPWSWYYRVVFRVRGIKCGPGLRVRGRILIEIDGNARNISLGSNVTLMPGVHLKNRENGRIVLGDRVKLDTGARLVAANDATIEIGPDTALGLGTVVNAGADVSVGRGALAGAHCVINASDHGMIAGRPIRDQSYEHAPIVIGDDVWLGAGSFVAKGSTIGTGAVISAGAVVSGTIPPNAVAVGSPARVVKFRG
jgi:fatty-acyl-CoA synthase